MALLVFSRREAGERVQIMTLKPADRRVIFVG